MHSEVAWLTAQYPSRVQYMAFYLGSRQAYQMSPAGDVQESLYSTVS